MMTSGYSQYIGDQSDGKQVAKLAQHESVHQTAREERNNRPSIGGMLGYIHTYISNCHRLG